jgi:hypothetical protein
MVAMRDSALLLSLKKKYKSPSRQLRCVYVNLAEGGVQLHIRLGQRRDHARRDVARRLDERGEAQVGRGILGIRNVLSTTSVGVLPTKITLPPALTKA